MVRVPLWPSLLVTATSTLPAVCAGAVAVIELLLATTTLVAAAPPSCTVAPAENPLPVMIIEVPPLADPEPGVTAVNTGGGCGP